MHYGSLSNTPFLSDILLSTHEKIKRKEKDMDTIQKDSKRPLYMACSICGKEIMLHEGYDYCQSRRRTMVYWHKSCYQKKREEDDGRGYDIKTVRKDS